ncbi:MAG TPA: hypothetical protein VMN76_10995 [Acidobacteriota bacterium]|nr:hypothetical protein [Acidobacteriota bacterium]
MATTVAHRPASPAAVGVYDRVFYSGMAISMALTVFVGFGPTYYLRLFSAEGPAATVSGFPITPLVHVHGVAFSAWVVLFIVQTALIAGRRVKFHQRLGIAGAVLAAVMIAIGTGTAIAGARAGSAPPGVDPLAFLIIPLGDMALFAIFVAAAIEQRRNKEAHKRLMLLAYIAILTAAVARWPGVMPLGPLGFYGLAFLFLFAGIGYDLISRKRVHRAYKWGGALLVLSVPARLAFSETGLWLAVAEYLVR